MARPADRFRPRCDERLPLRLPATLHAAGALFAFETEPEPESPPEPVMTPLPLKAAGPVIPGNEIDPVDLAVELTRIVPASGNLTVCGQQFWLGTHRAGLTLRLRADAGTVELLAAGVRIKKVPSRLTPQHLRQLIAEGGTHIQPTTTPAHPGAGAAVEVERTVNASGLVSLGGRQYPVGSPFAGRRLTVRLEGALLHLSDGRTLLRTLPNPLTGEATARLRDAHPAGPAPQPATEPVQVQRRVSSRGWIAVAGQRIGVGHAAATVTVEAADATFRITRAGQVIAEVARTTTKPIARFKVRKPQR